MAFNLKKVLKALLLSSSQPLAIKDIQAAFTRYHDAASLPLESGEEVASSEAAAGAEEVWLGVEPGSEVLAPPAYENPGKVVFYGTSITQGGCASRAGMAPAGQRLDAGSTGARGS